MSKNAYKNKIDGYFKRRGGLQNKVGETCFYVQGEMRQKEMYAQCAFQNTVPLKSTFCYVFVHFARCKLKCKLIEQIEIYTAQS